MAHRCECLCSASQLWLPHLALCVVPRECFRGLRIWSEAVGSKSGKLRNVADRDKAKDWEDRNNKAIETIFNHIDDQLVVKLGSIDSSHDIWMKIQT